jgi:hypothetical protein
VADVLVTDATGVDERQYRDFCVRAADKFAGFAEGNAAVYLLVGNDQYVTVHRLYRFSMIKEVL